MFNKPKTDGIHDGRCYDYNQQEYREVRVIESNGSLLCVEDRDNYDRKWVGREELEQ